MKLRLAGILGGGVALVGIGAVVGLVAVPALAAAHARSAASATSNLAVTDKTGRAGAAAYCGAFMGSFATHLGKTQAQIADAGRAAAADVLKQAVTDGKLTQAQADAITARLATSNDICALVGGLHGGARPIPGAGVPGPNPLMLIRDGYLTAAAGALGISPAELKADYAQGKTLHSLADAKGLTEAQFKEAFTAQVKTLLDAAVASGKLTSAQSQMLLSRVAAAPHLPGWDGPPGPPGTP